MNTNRSRTMRRWGAVTVAAVALVLASCAPGPATPNQAALQSAGTWLDSQFTAQNWFPGFNPANPDAVNAAQAVANLAALGIGPQSQSARLSRLADDMTTAMNDGTADVPGTIARYILAIVATGGNPRSVGGADLVDRLEATIQPDGRFGAQYPGFDGAYRQGVSLAALSVVSPRPVSITPGPGQTIADLPAVAWLLDQQCDDGSWMAFRSDTEAPCVEDPDTWTYKDSNGSAMAVLGLSAVGATAPADPANWFDSVRGDDGGWGAFPAGPTTVSDADSTGLVIAALESLGDAPDESAYTALRSFQLGSSAPAADQGAFTWQLAAPAPNAYATLDAMAALFDETWPQSLVPAS